MTLLYVAAGFFLGSISAVIIMAMFIMAKRADGDEVEMSADLASLASQREIT